MVWLKPLLIGEVVEQRYEPVGTYNFTLIVTDLSGAVGVSGVSVRVVVETTNDTTHTSSPAPTTSSNKPGGEDSVGAPGLVFSTTLVSIVVVSFWASRKRQLV